MRLTHLRDLTSEAPLASGHPFLSAASGLVVCGDRLFVVADDAHHLAVFTLGDPSPGRLIPLIVDELPRDAAARKRVKPDFEILVALPAPDPAEYGNRLLALGSGSTPQRMRGAIVDLPDGDGAPVVRLIDLQPLFAAIGALVPEVNLEGAVLRDDRLLLFNRGNMQHPASRVVEVPLAAVSGGGPIAATLVAELALPRVAGVPLTVTDACALENGHILLSTVAEATTDSYADGALTGAAIMELDAQCGLLRAELLEPPLKVEGIAVRAAGDRLELLCVTDADDPEHASGLYAGVWELGRMNVI